MLVFINKLLRLIGLKVSSVNSSSELGALILQENAEFNNFYKICKNFTMTSVERLFATYCATEYVIKNDIKGDFVECGVWKGGNSMMMALVLKKHGIKNRKIFMYDTYEGMSAPDENDKDLNGKPAKQLLEKSDKSKQNSIWCYSSLEEVKENMRSAQIELSNIEFVKGKVEDTIPQTMPTYNIAILRLDTDWYASTKHELEYLYPKLTQNGALIIDDYGHWQGSRKAVDEYFSKIDKTPFLNITDYTGRIAIKS